MSILTDILKEIPLSAVLREKVSTIETENAALKTENAILKDDLRQAKSQITQLNKRVEELTKPSAPYKFGVKWDNELNPLCPHCGAYLSNPLYIVQRTRPDISRFICAGCGRVVTIQDESGAPLRFKEARERMTAARESGERSQ